MKKTGMGSQTEGEAEIKWGKATSHSAEREELINRDRGPDRTRCRMEKNNSGLQGRGRN